VIRQLIFNEFSKEKLGLTDEVFMSVPCVLGQDGVSSLISQLLTKVEAEKLKNSAATLNSIQKDIVF
jgi:L-lactate dehydrogenase